MRTMAAVFKALSDETRLTMLGLLLREGELCVCDFVEVLEITQSKASRHLRYLVNAGLIQDRREAVWVYFRVHESPGEVPTQVLDCIRSFLPGRLSRELLAKLKAWQRSKTRESATCKARPSTRP